MQRPGSVLQPSCWLWKEADHVVPSSRSKINVSSTRTATGPANVTPGSLHSNLFSFTLQPVGGAYWLPGRDGQQRHIAWQIENGSAGRLTLSDSTGTQLVIQFPCQLFPGLVLLTPAASGHVGIVSITADGSLCCLDLDSHRQPSPLAGVQAQNLRFMDISTQWNVLGSPTQLLSTPEHVVIGGAQGPVLCLPSVAVLDANLCNQLSNELHNSSSAGYSLASGVFLLKGSGWGIKSMLAGVWQRAPSPSVVSLLHLPHPADHGKANVLLAVYDDGSLRGFSLPRQTQLFSDALPGCTTPKRSTPVYASLSPINRNASSAAGQPAYQAVLITEIESAETLARSVHLLVLQFLASGGKPIIRQQLQLESRPGASVVYSFASHDSAWILYRQPDGTSSLMRYLLQSDGQFGGMAVLLESRFLPLQASDGRGLGDAMAADIWEELLCCGSDSADGDNSHDARPTSAQQEHLASLQVMSRLLPPAASYRDTLADALKQYGIAVNQADISSATGDKLKLWLSNAVDAIQQRGAGSLSRARCWAQLLGACQEAWSRRHLALGLLADPQQSDQFLMIRGGGVTGLVCRGALVEALAFPASQLPITTPSTNNATTAAIANIQSLVTLPNPVAAIHHIAQQAGTLLGSFAQDAAIAALLPSGSHPLSDLAPLLVRLLLNGGSSNGAYADGPSQAQRSAWRAKRRQVLLNIGTTLSGLHDPATAIREYCGLLGLLPAARQQSVPAHQEGASSSSNCVLHATRQLAKAQASACRDMLLLLSLIVDSKLPCFGHPSSTASQQQQAEQLRVFNACVVMCQNMLRVLCEEMQRAALLFWLTTTPATTMRSQGQVLDSTLPAFATLHLGSTGGATNGAFGGQQLAKSGNGTAEISLAACILPHLLNIQETRLGDRATLDVNATALSAAVTLQYGSATTPSHIQDRLLQLGFKLFAAQECKALPGFTKLAIGASGRETAAADHPGMHLLEGLSLASSLRDVKGPQRASMVTAATTAFFKAAASLQSGASPILQQFILQLTQYLTTGSTSSDSNQNGIASTQTQEPLQLQLYEAALHIFEREGAPEGALAFAQAALQLCRTAAESGHNESDMQEDTPAVHTKHKIRQSRLWSNIFTYCCQLHAWSDAYAAIVNNPDTIQATDCLRTLVHELSSGGHLAELCALPLAGVLQIPSDPSGDVDMADTSYSRAQSVVSDVSAAPGPAFKLVSLRAEAIAALQRRAINSELTAKPQPYRILYDFLVTRIELREAAAAMLAYARRLRVEGRKDPGTYQEIILAYELCLHCLSITPATEAWLDCSLPWLAAHPLAAAVAPHLFAAGQTVTTAGSNGKKSEACLTASHIRQELAVLRAAVQTQGTPHGLDPLQHPLNRDEVLSRLLAAGQYDNALQLVSEGWPSGNTNALAALAQVVVSLAETAAHTQLKGVSATPQPLWLLSRDPQEQQLLLGSMHMASPAAPLWNKLRLLLQQYMTHKEDGKVQNGHHRGWGDVLRVAAADAILRVDRSMSIPMWLMHMFLDRNGPDDNQHGMAVSMCGPASLLHVYLSHDRLADSVALVSQSLDSWSTVDARRRQQHAAVWFPHTRIIELRQRLKDEVSVGNPAAAALLTELDTAVSRYKQILSQDADSAFPRHKSQLQLMDV